MRFDRRLERFRGDEWVYRHTACPGEQLFVAASYKDTQQFGSDKPVQGRLYRRGYLQGMPWHPWFKTPPRCH